MKNIKVNQNELALLIKLIQNYQKEIEEVNVEANSDGTMKIGNEANKNIKVNEASKLLAKLKNTIKKQ